MPKPEQIRGDRNPNWKGGLIDKTCQQCGKAYAVKRVHAGSKFCSLQCVGVSQRGSGTSKGRTVTKVCEVCSKEFAVFASHESRFHCCSKACSHQRRAAITAGEANPNWLGGMSRHGYPWDFRAISKAIIERDGSKCMNPTCRGEDARLTAHHIDYDKSNCSPSNLICLCSSCNSRANFNRSDWQALYSGMIAADLYPFEFIAVRKQPKKAGGGFVEEHF